jgi:hypothetical protein
MLQAWRDGGYSDDLTLAARCTELGLPIAVPSFSLYPQRQAAALRPAPCGMLAALGVAGGLGQRLPGQPQAPNPALPRAGCCGRGSPPDPSPAPARPHPRLERGYSARQYWNYLRRQLYVLDTYSNAHNRRLNRLMVLAQCWVGLALAAALLLAGTAAGALLWSWAGRALGAAAGGQRLLGSWEGVVWEGGHGEQQPPWQTPAASAAGAASAAALPRASAAVLLCLAAATAALRYMVRQVALLLLHLHPSDPSLKRELLGFSCAKLWLGLLAEGLVSPPCMLYTFCSPYITWAGIRYAKRGGKVSRVSTSA